MKRWGNLEILRCGKHWPVVRYYVRTLPRAAWWAIRVLLLIGLASAQTTVTITGNIKVTSSIRVDWTASATPSVTYNIYRSETSGGPYTKMNTGIGCCTWTDLGTQPKHTYYYVLTAVDASSNESAQSTESNAALVP